MPNPGPLDPLATLGDALLQMAPHNVLASMANGGQITITPVLARQPTLYEEMTRATYPPRAAPAPASTPSPEATTIFDAGDAILGLAPHNILYTLLTGGQVPPGVLPSTPNGGQGPSRPTALPAAIGDFKDLPIKVNLLTFRTGQSGGVTPFANDMAVAINGKNSYYEIKVQDREFITLLYVIDMKPTKIYQTDQIGFAKVSKELPRIPRPSLPVSVPDPPGGFGFIKEARVVPVSISTWKITNYWGHGEKKEQTILATGVALYTVTEYDDRVLVYLIPPIAPSQKDITMRGQQMKEWDVRHPPAAPTEGLDALRARYLSDVDGWIGDAQLKITNMKLTDIAQANSTISDISGAVSGLGQANTTGQAPPIPLFSGGALPFPLFAGGVLPFLPLFPIMRGGQAGSASGYVSSLNSLLSKANSVKAQMDRDTQSADNSLSNMQTYRNGIASAPDESGIEYNHTRAKNEYDNVVEKADSVHRNATEITSYRSSAKSSYEAGVVSITGQAPPGAGAAAQAAAQRAQQIAAQEELLKESAVTEARMQTEAEQRRAQEEQRMAAARERLTQQLAAERAAAELKRLEQEQKVAEMREQEAERKRQGEKFEAEMEARRQAELEAKRKRQESAEEVARKALELRQEAARRRLKR